MSKLAGRNDACPCGSGKKYKKCCMEKDREVAAEARLRRVSETLEDLDQDDDLDELSNSVPDLIKEGRLEEAEKRCAELRRKYPDVGDWIWCTAEVLEARGNRKGAAEYFRKAADYAERNEGFDEKDIRDLRERARRLERPEST